MLRLTVSALLASLLVPALAGAQVRVHPTGVNVNMNGSTTVFLTFGGLTTHRAAEATWCGELTSAAPDLGLKCDPSTIFGRLPIRLDLSTTSGASGFTDIMSIPESVARRARQAAVDGAASAFFYVRRFVNLAGGPDQYVAVTCRLAGGGARVPFAITAVTLRVPGDQPVLLVRPGATPTPFEAQISFNGTGRLVGRWEVVMPGDPAPDARDLVPEAALPVEERGSQRRYTEVGRFNVFLPPVGRATIPGPEPARLPTTGEGVHQVLLRIEAVDDKEGDSSLSASGAGTGVVHSGGVAGFPMPTLRYVVGSASNGEAQGGTLRLLAPLAMAELPATVPFDFTWASMPSAATYRLDVRGVDGAEIASAVLNGSTTVYRAPSFLLDKAKDGFLRWRVTAYDAAGTPIDDSGWRALKLTRQ